MLKRRNLWIFGLMCSTQKGIETQYKASFFFLKTLLCLERSIELFQTAVLVPLPYSNLYLNMFHADTVPNNCVHTRWTRSLYEKDHSKKGTKCQQKTIAVGIAGGNWESDVAWYNIWSTHLYSQQCKCSYTIRPGYCTSPEQSIYQITLVFPSI